MEIVKNIEYNQKTNKYKIGLIIDGEKVMFPKEHAMSVDALFYMQHIIDFLKASEKPSECSLDVVSKGEAETVCKHPFSQRRFSYNSKEQCGVCRQYL